VMGGRVIESSRCLRNLDSGRFEEEQAESGKTVTALD
jgi:hypothetical protein